MKRHLATCAFLAVLVCGVAAAEEVSTIVAAPVDRVWTVTEAVLRQLGWDVDKADRSIGWITTGSRGLEGEDYGVYAKGIRHRLRIRIKDAGAGQTTVAIERTVFKRERILFVDNDEPIATTDRSVEQAVLDAIRKAL